MPCSRKISRIRSPDSVPVLPSFITLAMLSEPSAPFSGSSNVVCNSSKICFTAALYFPLLSSAQSLSYVSCTQASASSPNTSCAVRTAFLSFSKVCGLVKESYPPVSSATDTRSATMPLIFSSSVYSAIPSVTQRTALLHKSSCPYILRSILYSIPPNSSAASSDA